jgi:hypothetical protein
MYDFLAEQAAQGTQPCVRLWHEGHGDAWHARTPRTSPSARTSGARRSSGNRTVGWITARSAQRLAFSARGAFHRGGGGRGSAEAQAGSSRRLSAVTAARPARLAPTVDWEGP